jgi:hypothetical protein
MPIARLRGEERSGSRVRGAGEARDVFEAIAGAVVTDTAAATVRAHRGHLRW